jgi:hypothetical protein
MNQNEHKLDLILWALDLSQLPEHPATKELKALQFSATQRLIQHERDSKVQEEYMQMKERIKIIEEDYPNLLK